MYVDFIRIWGGYFIFLTIGTFFRGPVPGRKKAGSDKKIYITSSASSFYIFHITTKHKIFKIKNMNEEYQQIIANLEADYVNNSQCIEDNQMLSDLESDLINIIQANNMNNHDQILATLETDFTYNSQNPNSDLILATLESDYMNNSHNTMSSKHNISIESSKDLNVSTPSGDSEYAKKIAIKLKKEGKVDYALKWLRYSKTVAPLQIKDKSFKSVGSADTENVKKRDQFSELESNIILALKNLSMKHSSKSSEILSIQKSYLNHLSIIDAKRTGPHSNTIPPKFTWKNVRKLLPLELLDIPEDTIHICIHAANKLKALLKDNESKLFSITYNLGFPRDHPIVGTTQQTKYNMEEDSIDFNHEVFIPIKITRSLASLIPKRKAEISLIMHKGFFPFNYQEPLGQVILPLSDLNQQCECVGLFELTKIKEGGAKRKAVGGAVSVSIRVRHPLGNEGLQSIVSEERILEIDEWPHKNTSQKSDGLKEVNSVSEISINKDENACSSTKSAEIIDTANKTLSPLEMKDPFNIKFYIANDVLEEEISAVKSQINSIPQSNEEELSEMKLRLQQLEANLMILVRNVQEEKLTLEEYLSQLKDRIIQDKRLAAYLNSTGRKNEALRVLKRFKNMEKEVSSAQ